MNVVEINKYPPRLFRNGRFLRQDWTSVSQLGELWDGRELTPAAYLAIEDRYVRAMERFMAAAGVDDVAVQGLEFWNDVELPGLALPPRAAPLEGERVPAAEAGNLLRRFLREQAWAELVVAPRFLVHPGYDMRLLIASEVTSTELEDDVRRSGLFTYPGSDELPTLRAWSGERS